MLSIVFQNNLFSKIFTVEQGKKNDDLCMQEQQSFPENMLGGRCFPILNIQRLSDSEVLEH